ncbi:MAG: glycosyltransferase family 39 protein, partial [Gaiellaceae bacterium]
MAGQPAAATLASERVGRGELRHALRWLALVVALKSALNLAVAGRYGWQRDELYYLVAGRHLSGGYVDYPPVTALLARVADTIFGASLVGFRLFAVLAGAGVVILGALVARELGGDSRAQLVAAVAVACSPILIATNGLFQPVSFDELLSMLLLYLALRLALRPSGRLWALIGVTLGIGLETKYTIAVLAIVMLASFLAAGRAALRPGDILAASAIAGLIFLPNLVWQARHGWISVHWFVHPGPSATSETRPQFLIAVLLLTSPVAVPVAVAGLRLLWRDARLRPLALTCLGTIAAYFALNGKSYYAAPVALFATAAGAVPFTRWALARLRRLLLTTAAFAGLLLIALPIGLPVLP